MKNTNAIPNLLSGANERELLTLSVAEITDALMADYKNFSSGIQEGISIPGKLQEPRMAHSSILYAEGLRLAQTHLDEAKKLIIASLFNFNEQAKDWLAVKEIGEAVNPHFDIFDAILTVYHTDTRAIRWLRENGEQQLLDNILKSIKDFEDYKAEERRKEEERKELFRANS